MYKLEILEECESTQEEVKKRLNETSDIAVLSLKQSKGKGSYGREWISDKGGLYLSFDFPSINTTIPVSIVFSLLVLESINQYLDIENQNFIKDYMGIIFPNDLVLEIDNNFYKIGGILVESLRNKYIIGIGVNVNNHISFYQLEHKAISLKEFFEKETNLSIDFDVFKIAKIIISKAQDLRYSLNENDYLFSEFLKKLDKFDFTKKLRNVDVILFMDGKEIVDRFDQLKVDFQNRKIIFYKNRMRKELDFEKIRRILY